MISETGDRICNVDDLIKKVMEKSNYSNKSILEKFLRETRSNMAVEIRCKDSCNDGTRYYNVVGEIKCRFAPTGCDMPQGVYIERLKGEDYISYSHIHSFRILK
jgi:hypothetical protein